MKRFSMKLLFCILPLQLFLSHVPMHAQDYLISFEGSGTVSAVASVKVENITQGTSETIRGTYILHLKGSMITGKHDFRDLGKIISFSPNPITDYSLMRFITQESGNTTISLYDFSGKKLKEGVDFLPKGLHTYGIYGIKKGLYFVAVRYGRSELSGTLICTGSSNSDTKIIYENTISITEIQNCTEVDMQYTYGDRLKFTGYSGNCSTEIFDVPVESKTINFIFSPCTDGDGNNYRVVQIGSQLWMSENLKTTRYKDKKPIPNVTDGVEWAGLITPAFCWSDNNIKYRDVYGALYNWYVVKTGRLCPEGWHVPTDAEWHEMVLYLDPNAVLDVEESDIAGGKLKEEGTVHWAAPNTGAADVNGFKALPGGVRKYNGVFSGFAGHGNWRTSSEYDDTQVWYRYIYYYSASLYRKPTNMKAGYSVRCVSD